MSADFPLNTIYVIEPELIQCADDVINMSRQFGISNTGRLLAIYPFNYFELIEGKIDSSSLRPIRQERYIENLNALKSFGVKHPFSINPKLSWAQMAASAIERGHINKSVGAGECEEFSDLDDLLAKAVSRSVSFIATQNNFSTHLNNIFMASNSIKIVDPYFHDERRFSLLAELIERAGKSEKCKEVEVIVGLTRYYHRFGERDGSSIKQYASLFNQRHSFSKIKYTIVNDQEKQYLLHERLVLSNLGGLELGRGLEVNPGRKEQISCLDQRLFNEFLEKYRNIRANHPGSISIALNYNE